MTDAKALETLDRERAGQALKILRKRAGMTQEAAADAASLSVPAWKNYERGVRFMDNPTLAKAMTALGMTPEDHAQEVARIVAAERPARNDRPHTGMSEPGRVFQLPVGGVAHGGATRPNVYDEQEPEVLDFAAYFTPGSRVLRLAGMSMYPYADAGGFVTFDVRRPPRRGQGCVIEKTDGTYYVKRFESIDDTTLHVTELYPEERALTFPLDDIKGVYAIGLRGD